ncbi:hypothetical protein H8N03_06495 [Ramlibacter sp. USB13]|uniref:Uncharacterized protein n=1 Tax=Ramlibacter cellulosilyticus TaxID=2764187 RepID=A0A923MRP0_9BURK|nr:hypothetical protein [Ramlibacter cellulosilyticus]MBC5782587.1 hypothetical protein [Ramlibacter cellulosilyticus]
MKKISLVAAGVLAAAAGLAQAQSVMLEGHNVVTTVAAEGQRTFWIDTPVMSGSVIPGSVAALSVDSTPVAVIHQDSVLAAAPVSSDTTILGAGPLLRMDPSMYTPPGLVFEGR